MKENKMSYQQQPGKTIISEQHKEELQREKAEHQA